MPPIPGFRGKVMVSMRQSYGLSHRVSVCRERRKTIRGDEDGVFYSVSRKVRRPAAAADWCDSNVNTPGWDALRKRPDA